ncbi:MAG TPA: PspA/IM30 family protein [Jatrophihabitans sp.]|nr:PspA/IM30 family protein [Jatrophihabitans sp.]
MANGFAKAWHYVSTWFSAKVDEKADPAIQIQQAIEEAQQQHARLTAQAAGVIGQQHQLELKLDRKLAEIETLSSQARQALVLADDARTKGEAQKAGEFEQTAEQIANQLVSAESEAASLKQLHDQSIGAARQAKQAVEDNKVRLQEKLTERTKLLSQLEQAKMQEQVSASLNQMSELSAPSNIPTLDAVRDKIEKRYATALGQAELANDSLEGRMAEVKRATTNMAAQSRLAEIRAAMNGPERLQQTPAAAGAEAIPAQSAPSLEKGGSSQDAGAEEAGRPAAQPADPAN